MSEPTYEEALAHFGVKGMRWGHRKKSGGGTVSTTHYPGGRTVTTKTKGPYPTTDAARKAHILETVNQLQRPQLSKGAKAKVYARVGARFAAETALRIALVSVIGTAAYGVRVNLGKSSADRFLEENGDIPLYRYKNGVEVEA
jgi:hypothetical protein